MAATGTVAKDTGKSLARTLSAGRMVTLARVPDGYVGKALGDLARTVKGRTIFVARDGQRLAEIERALAFFAPEVEPLPFPAWDCLPYDRVSPHPTVVARRMATLSRLLLPTDRPGVVLTTVNGVLQRAPSRSFVEKGSFSAAPGNQVRMDDLVHWLEDNGFARTTTVREAGEYAVRGGILDLFPAGLESPVRLDFFGNTLESIRSFDADSQRTIASRKRVELVPANEMVLSAEAIARFRQGYVTLFGTADRDDLLYQSISERRRYVGMEHWLPLFSEGLETLFDYTSGSPAILDHLVEEAVGERLDLIEDHYEARRSGLLAGQGGVPYRPLPPDRLYLARAEWAERLGERPRAMISPFAQPDRPEVIDMGARGGGALPPSAPPATSTSSMPSSAISERCRRPQARPRRLLERECPRLYGPGPRRPRAHPAEAGGRLGVLPRRSPARMSALPSSASRPASRPIRPRSSASRTSSATGSSTRIGGRAGRPIS